MDYKRLAAEFLLRGGAALEYVKLGKAPGPKYNGRSVGSCWKYRVVIRRGDSFYDFPFYDSVYNCRHGIRPTAYDILACLEKYLPESDVWEFAKEFGYTIASRGDYDRVAKVRQECEDQYNSLLALFGEEEMEKLREIQ